MARIFDAGIDFGIDTCVQSLVPRVYGFRLRAEPLPRPSSTRFPRRDFEKGSGSGPLLEGLLGGAQRRNLSADSHEINGN